MTNGRKAESNQSEGGSENMYLKKPIAALLSASMLISLFTWQISAAESGEAVIYEQDFSDYT